MTAHDDIATSWTDLPDQLTPAQVARFERYETLAVDVEHGIQCLGEHLHHTLDRVQDLPAVAESEDLWWQTENLRRSVDHLPAELEYLDALLSELYHHFGPKVPKSAGPGFVGWREGPWTTIAPRTDDD